MVMAVLGAAALVLKPVYHGPLEGVVYSYAGNFSVSFALYFGAVNATARYQRPRLMAALAVLVAVEAFELTNGFGVMANVFDPLDLVANALGVAFAVAVDAQSSRVMSADPRRGKEPSASAEPTDGADAQ